MELEDGALVVRRHTAWIGDLSHWNFGTFEVKWRDRSMGDGLLTFELSAQGEVAALQLEDFEVFDRVKKEDVAHDSAADLVELTQSILQRVHAPGPESCATALRLVRLREAR